MTHEGQSAARVSGGGAFLPSLAIVTESARFHARSSAFLVGSVLAAVHHAEVVAHRVGEPFGSLVLAAAVASFPGVAGRMERVDEPTVEQNGQALAGPRDAELRDSRPTPRSALRSRSFR